MLESAAEAAHVAGKTAYALNLFNLAITVKLCNLAGYLSWLIWLMNKIRQIK